MIWIYCSTLPAVCRFTSLKHFMLHLLLPICLLRSETILINIMFRLGEVHFCILWVSYGTKLVHGKISQEIITSHLFIGYMLTRTTISSPSLMACWHKSTGFFHEGRFIKDGHNDFAVKVALNWISPIHLFLHTSSSPFLCSYPSIWMLTDSFSPGFQPFALSARCM